MRRVSLVGVLVLCCAEALAQSSIEVAAFSRAKETLPANWQPLIFKKIERHTDYQLVEDGGVTVVKAQAQASASGLQRALQVDLRQTPILRWRWKVSNTLRNADPRKKSGDDYPARIYITFAYDAAKLGFAERTKYSAAKLIYGEYPPLAAINYIWDSHTPAGTILPNAYTGRVKMIVVESGKTRLNQWLAVERNVYADYRAAFGEEPGLVSGIAIMTDTDNTGESATAFYGDIEFRSQ